MVQKHSLSELPKKESVRGGKTNQITDWQTLAILVGVMQNEVKKSSLLLLLAPPNWYLAQWKKKDILLCILFDIYIEWIHVNFEDTTTIFEEYHKK